MSAEAASDRLMQAYNTKNFDEMEAMIAPDIDFAHFNRNFAINTRDELLAVLRQFAADFFADRRFEPPERVTVCGSIVVREAWYSGTTLVDVPGFGAAGEDFRLKLCSVMRFDENDVLVEWKDFG
jgi:hypothetical protein